MKLSFPICDIIIIIVLSWQGSIEEDDGQRTQQWTHELESNGIGYNNLHIVRDKEKQRQKVLLFLLSLQFKAY